MVSGTGSASSAAASPNATPDRPSTHSLRRPSTRSDKEEDNRQVVSPRDPHDGTLSPLDTPPSSHRVYHAAPSALRPLQEYHSGFADVRTDDLSPAAHAHRRQQSFPSFFPSVLKYRAPSPTGTTSPTRDDMPLTGDSKVGMPENSRGVLPGWLGGKATASPLGGPPKSDGRGPNAAPRSRAGSQQSTISMTPTSLRKAQSGNNESPAPRNTVSSTASRFMSAISKFAQGPMSPTLDDELYYLDIEMALFPMGLPTDRDAVSPAAFRRLQDNATVILSKYQIAYRQRVNALRDLEDAQSARRDALEEAETRAEHLKLQLEGMALKATEQEKKMRELMDQLAADKETRAEEGLAREKDAAALRGAHGGCEDLVIGHGQLRRTWRKSGDTVKTDTSFETTDEESVESESIFSRSRSPVPSSTVEGSVIDTPAPQARVGAVNPPKRRSGQQLSTFQKIFKGISRDPDEGAGASSCRNCKGQDASIAWDTVGLLRDENRYLKQRKAELEVAVEGALDLVNGIGL